jgi:tryptophan synthase beta subunit
MGGPSPPPVPKPDPNVIAQQQAALAREQNMRAQEKEMRLQDSVAALSGMGSRSLMTGRRGSRSLLEA